MYISKSLIAVSLLKKYYNKHANQSWVTKGIKTACNHKRDLYMLCINTNNSMIKTHYKIYCKILSKVINVAKRQHFNNFIKHSKNKSKTVWSAVKAETSNEASKDKIPLTMKNKSIKNYHDPVNVFNDYFINVTNTYQEKDRNTNIQALSNLYSVFNKPYLQLNMAPVNAKEMKNII